MDLEINTLEGFILGVHHDFRSIRSLNGLSHFETVRQLYALKKIFKKLTSIRIRFDEFSSMSKVIARFQLGFRRGILCPKSFQIQSMFYQYNVSDA